VASAVVVEQEGMAERVFRGRAFEAVVWGMPAVNFELMYQAMVHETGGGFNQIVYWSGLPDWKNQTLTPNPDSIYLIAFIDTTDVGPVVLEIPAADDGSITGTVMDCWQAPLEDVGPAGVDKGEGGKYVILPPGYTDELPDDYIPLPSDTYSGFALLRSILRSGSPEDVAQAVAYGLRVKLYPLAQANGPPPTAFADASDVVFDATIPYDRRFFGSLDRMVQREPWLTRDKAMIDILKSIGIEKGKPFEPDAKTQALLDDAAAEAHAWLDARYESILSSGFYEDSQWALPVTREMIEGMQSFFANPDSYPVDDRGVSYSMAFFSPKHSGTGSFYLLAIRDQDGEPLDGAGTYRLAVPADAPVNQVLVGDDLRSGDPRADPEHAAVEPLLAVPGSENERGRIDRHLLRPREPGREEGQLGPDQPRKRIRGAVPVLRSRAAAVRQKLAASGHREADLNASSRRL